MNAYELWLTSPVTTKAKFNTVKLHLPPVLDILTTNLPCAGNFVTLACDIFHGPEPTDLWFGESEQPLCASCPETLPFEYHS